MPEAAAEIDFGAMDFGALAEPAIQEPAAAGEEEDWLSGLDFAAETLPRRNKFRRKPPAAEIDFGAMDFGAPVNRWLKSQPRKRMAVRAGLRGGDACPGAEIDFGAMDFGAPAEPVAQEPAEEEDWLSGWTSRRRPPATAEQVPAEARRPRSTLARWISARPPNRRLSGTGGSGRGRRLAVRAGLRGGDACPAEPVRRKPRRPRSTSARWTSARPPNRWLKSQPRKRTGFPGWTSRRRRLPWRNKFRRKPGGRDRLRRDGLRRARRTGGSGTGGSGRGRRLAVRAGLRGGDACPGGTSSGGSPGGRDRLWRDGLRRAC